MDAKKIPKEVLDKILASRPKEVEDALYDHNINLLVDFVHTICCSEKHGYECHYYQECELTETWTRPAHLRWKAVTQIAVEDTGLDLANDAAAVMSIIPAIATVALVNDRLLDFITELLKIRRRPSPHHQDQEHEGPSSSQPDPSEIAGSSEKSED